VGRDLERARASDHQQMRHTSFFSGINHRVHIGGLEFRRVHDCVVTAEKFARYLQELGD
jgi:hypothetical protein